MINPKHLDGEGKNEGHLGYGEHWDHGGEGDMCGIVVSGGKDGIGGIVVSGVKDGIGGIVVSGGKGEKVVEGRIKL